MQRRSLVNTNGAEQLVLPPDLQEALINGWIPLSEAEFQLRDREANYDKLDPDGEYHGE